MFSFSDATNMEHRLAFVRWLSSAPGAELPMRRLTWAKQGAAGSHIQQAWYECVDIDCIERPVFLQPDPGHEGFFYFNHFMGCASRRPPARSCSRAGTPSVFCVDAGFDTL